MEPDYAFSQGFTTSQARRKLAHDSSRDRRLTHPGNPGDLDLGEFSGVALGVTDVSVRSRVRSLEQKKYLTGEQRVGQTNRFDLQPLFVALENELAAHAKKDASKKEAV